MSKTKEAERSPSQGGNETTGCPCGPMPSAREVVEAFLDAFYGGDAKSARGFLADDFSFAGPSQQFHDPDHYVRASAHVVAGLRSLVKHKIFADGDDVGSFYELVVNHAVGRIAVAERYRLSHGKIASIHTIFDTGPFVAGARGRSTNEETAVDPVCKMQVTRADAAATRKHAGRDYYFCASVCAESFDADPGRYAER